MYLSKDLQFNCNVKDLTWVEPTLHNRENV